MPFEREDGAPLDELALAQRPADGQRFRLLAGFVYVEPRTGARFPVSASEPAAASGPAGSAGTPWDSDLASVPHPFWGLIASYGRQSAPAILHDWRSVLAARLAERDRRAALAQRRVDDRVFRIALREQRVPVLRAWLMWAWVSADREREFGGAAGRIFVIQSVLGALLILAAVLLAWWHPAWLALAAVPLLAAFAWGGLAPLQLVLTGSGAVFAPVIVLHLVSIGAFRLVEAIVELVRGGDPRDVVRPTLTRRGARG
jgi:hypothetical protein